MNNQNTITLSKKEQTKKNLFEPVNQQGLDLKNRIVMAPMTRARAIGSIPNDLMAAYYAQRSSAGLTITEGTAPSPDALGYARIPGIFNDKQVAGWSKITDAVHQKNGKIFIQLMHTGRIAHPDNMPEHAEIVAPSAIRPEGKMWTDTDGLQPFITPNPIPANKIDDLIEEFEQAAGNAMEAGFDGVEIHGANGYLLDQFLNPHVNVRRDDYGGNIKNRSRFVLEVTEAVGRSIGNEKVGIRFSPYSTFNDMPLYEETYSTYDYLSKKLDALDIAYLHVVESAAREHTNGADLVATMRKNFSNLFIVNGGYTKEKAIDAVEQNYTDLVSFGAPFIANPDLPERVLKDIPLAVPDADTFYTPGEKGYTDYPVHYESEE